jgi:hypothetical protein
VEEEEVEKMVLVEGQQKGLGVALLMMEVLRAWVVAVVEVVQVERLVGAEVRLD